MTYVRDIKLYQLQYVRALRRLHTRLTLSPYFRLLFYQTVRLNTYIYIFYIHIFIWFCASLFSALAAI